MANPSNLYADKILQQHPMALWTLDSDAKYLSLITDAQRNLSTGWTLSSSFLGTTVSDLLPKLGTTVSLLYKDSVSAGTFFTAISDFTFDSNTDSFTIGAYVAKASPYITQIAIGYDIGGTITYSTPTITITEDMYSYQYVSATFNTAVTGAKVVLRFNYSTPATADRVSVFVNGLAVGQYAEDFSVEDLGTTKSSIPSTIAIPKAYGIPAAQYNTAFDQPSGDYVDNVGYYVVYKDVIYARNTAHPMVYGCTNSTRIYPYTANEPSLILPGYGFLNESDKYKTKTYEMWLRVKSSTLSIKRIFGPVAGDNGLYVDGANLILKIGNSFISHYVGEWDRPMLVQIVTSKSGTELFINGDIVGNIKYDVADISFPEYYYPTTLANLISNSNFETNTTGWSVRNGTVASSSTDYFVGTKMALFTVGSSGTTAGINVSATSTYMPAVTPGETVTYSIYVKDVNTAKSYRSYIDFYDSTPTFISGSGVGGTITTVSTTNWTRISVTAIVPAGAAYARPYTYSTTTFSAGDVGKQVYFDGALFQKSNVLNPYISGTPSNVVQDYVGFYAHSDVSLETSSFAVYNYGVTRSIALSRWSYGQALQYPAETVSSHSGGYMVPDYTFAKYANNQNYGVSQGNTWKSGKINNFIVDKDTLSTPNYSLPTIEIEPAYSSTNTQTSLMNTLSTLNATYIDLQPDSSWTGIESHIFFNTFKPIINDVDLFYVVFDKSENNTATKQIIFQIVDPSTGNYLEASVIGNTGNTLSYYFYYNNLVTPTTIAQFAANSLSTKYAVGINITNLIASNSNFANFFANRDSLKVYVGGSKAFDNDQTFTGKIYKVGFGDSRNYSKVSSSFNASGYFNAAAAGVLDTHTASYTLVTQNPWSNYSCMDIATNSYWQDSIPLSRLAKTVDGTYGINYVQFNVDYPNQIDTTNADTKTYVTFQTVASGMNKDILDASFSSTTTVGTNRYLGITSSWTSTKYQVVDGTVIYVPTNVSFDTLALVAHIEINNPGTLLNPTNIRHLQIAAQTVGTSTVIGTKGEDLVPFGTGDNPVLISKFNDPHYYLTSQSGFRVVGTNSASRGYYFNLNKDKHDDFNLGAIQFAAKFVYSQFANSQTQLFEVQNIDDATKVIFYVIGENAGLDRGRIYAKDQSGTAYTAIKYYLNGVEVKNPIVSSDEWFMLGIKFTSDYSLDSKAGKVNFSGNMLVNRFEYFQSSISQRKSAISVYRKWINIRYSGTASKTWNNYTGNTWNYAAITPTTTLFVGINASDIAEAFTGTNKKIVGKDYLYPRLDPQSMTYRVFLGTKGTKNTAIPL